MEYDPAIKGTKKQLSAKEVEDLKKEYREEKKRVDWGKYGFTEEDFEKLVAILPRLFDNDASSARPAGSMEVLSVVVTNDASKHSKRELDNAVEVNYSQELHDFDTVTFKYKKGGYLDED